jgi:hypothetical protein
MRALKIFLETAQMQFEAKAITFPKHVEEGIKKSMQQHRNGQTISLQEFKDKHLSK